MALALWTIRTHVINTRFKSKTSMNWDCKSNNRNPEKTHVINTSWGVGLWVCVVGPSWSCSWAPPSANRSSSGTPPRTGYGSSTELPGPSLGPTRHRSDPTRRPPQPDPLNSPLKLLNSMEESKWVLCFRSEFHDRWWSWIYLVKMRHFQARSGWENRGT